MTVRQYVETNFTEIEKSLFEYLISSFPESVLVINNEESEDILSLLATLAKVIGNSKELILNLKTGHSIEEIFNKIENDYLAENNKNILLPLSSDLKYHRLSDDLETEELIDRLVKEKPFVLDYYNLYKNRGTLTAINQIVKKFSVFLEREDLPFNVYEFNTEMDIILENVGQIERFGDFTQGDFNLTINDELVEVVPVRKDNIIFDMLMKIKPVGFAYNILLKYLSSIILNLQEDRIVGKDGRISLIEPQVFASQDLLNTNLPIIEDLTIDDDFFEGPTAPNANNYVVDIKNISTAVSLEAYVADWVNAGQLSSASRFEDLLYRTAQEPITALSYGQDVANRKNYIFDTKSALDNYINTVQPTSGRFLVTGFRWDLTTLAAFNAATNAITVTDTVTTGDAPDRFDMEIRTIPSLAVRNQYPSGDIVVRFIRTVTSTNETLTRYFRLVTVTTGGFPGAPTLTGLSAGVGSFLIAGFKGFTFEKYVIPPNSVKTIQRTSTDPSYAGLAQFIGVYFTNVNRPLEKTANLIAPFNNPQQVNIGGSPISLAFKPKINVTLVKEEQAIVPLPEATLVPNSISKTNQVISGLLANGNTGNIPNLSTQIRLLNNATGIFGPWETLQTASNFRNNIVFSFSGLSANTQYTFQTRNITSTQGFEPVSETNQYQETTQMAQQLSPPVFEEQGLQIGETAFTVTYSNPNDISATLTVFIDETQDFQEVTIPPFSDPGGPTVSVTFADGPLYQIDPGTTYTIAARLSAPGRTTSQFTEDIIQTLITVAATANPTSDNVVPTENSVSFRLCNQDSSTVTMNWGINSVSDNSQSVAANSCITRTISGLDSSTPYVLKYRATASGKDPSALRERNFTTLGPTIPKTATPGTTAVSSTVDSVTFGISNNDTSAVTISWQIQGPFGTAASGSENVPAFNGFQAIATGLSPDTTYSLISVVATAAGKDPSDTAPIRNLTTSAATATGTRNSNGGNPSYGVVTGPTPLLISKPSPNPSRTGFTFFDWNPSLPATINNNTEFIAQWQLFQPTVNIDPNEQPIISVTNLDIQFNFRNNNTGNYANVVTQIRVATAGNVAVTGPKGDWVNIANFPNNQTNLNYIINKFADNTPLDPNTPYVLAIRNVASPANDNIITSNESTIFVETGDAPPPPQRIVRAILVTSSATSGVDVQFDIEGPNNYSETGNVDLNSTSYTFLRTDVPDGSNALISVPETFVFSGQTYSLNQVTVVNNVSTVQQISTTEFEILDINQNTNINISYIVIASGGGGGAGGAGGGGGPIELVPT